MPSLLDPASYQRLLFRLRALRPEATPRWGTLTAPRLLVHLGDQMRHTLGDIEVPSRHGILRWPLIKPALMFWLPWPRGRVKSPPQLLATRPAEWSADLATLESLLARFVAQTGRQVWPDHILFGAMTWRSWGRFAHRHFDYHLRQFGV